MDFAPFFWFNQFLSSHPRVFDGFRRKVFATESAHFCACPLIHASLRRLFHNPLLSFYWVKTLSMEVTGRNA